MDLWHTLSFVLLLYNLRCNCDGLRIDLDMAAAGVAILDNPVIRAQS